MIARGKAAAPCRELGRKCCPTDSTRQPATHTSKVQQTQQVGSSLNQSRGTDEEQILI